MLMFALSLIPLVTTTPEPVALAAAASSSGLDISVLLVAGIAAVSVLWSALLTNRGKRRESAYSLAKEMVDLRMGARTQLIASYKRHVRIVSEQEAVREIIVSGSPQEYIDEALEKHAEKVQRILDEDIRAKEAALTALTLIPTGNEEQRISDSFVSKLGNAQDYLQRGPKTFNTADYDDLLQSMFDTVLELHEESLKETKLEMNRLSLVLSRRLYFLEPAKYLISDTNTQNWHYRRYLKLTSQDTIPTS